jgi:3-methylcrotonyl-CoA carboxylase alpha subunit
VSDTHEPTVTRLGDGRWRVVAHGQQHVAYAVAAGDAVWVFLNGRTYIVETSRSGRVGRRPQHDDQDALASPMPATVERITVERGQSVTTGDVLIVLEAMKMELTIKAPRDGRVKAIACRAGELVQPGVPLIELE